MRGIKTGINVGDTFGDLTVIEILGKIRPQTSNHWYYKVQCKCGTKNIVRGTVLKNGRSAKCRKCAIKRTPNRRIQYKHGMTNTRLFNIWQSMKERCNTPTSHAYKWYGGRGIKICDEWENDFMAFYNWAINNGYKEILSIDRIDVNGNYEPSNCRWATTKAQANNKRTNRFLTLNGETHTMAEWGIITGIKDYNIENRLNKYGWSVEKTLTTPVIPCKRKKNVC